MKIVTAAIVEDNGRYLIAKRRLGEKLAGMLEFPGGKVEFGESLPVQVGEQKYIIKSRAWRNLSPFSAQTTKARSLVVLQV